MKSAAMTKTRPSLSKFVMSDDRREAGLSLLLVLQLLTIFSVAPLIGSSHGQHIGQFYMGTLIASLIGLHVSSRHEKNKKWLMQ